jgi:hypothetical protein
MPQSPLTITLAPEAAFLLHNSVVKPATAKSYLGALRSFHIQEAHSTAALDDDCLPLIIRGGKRIYGEGEKAIRYPLTSDILLCMVHEINHDEEGVNVRAAFCVAFAAFLRSGDFTWDTWSPDSHLFHLSREHVVFHPTSVTLTLPASKMDQFHVGVEIYLAYSPLSLLCPVTALRALFNRYPAHPHAPLFTRPFKQPFTKPSVVLMMHQLLLNAGISTFCYSGHSLHKGAAVTADRNGISKHDIKLLGRWKSDAVDVYINERQKPDHMQKILCLNSQLLSPLH